MNRPVIGSLLFICLLLTACSGDDDPLVTTPIPPVCDESADPAPNLVLADLDGAEHDLSSYRCEKVILLEFWASWCGPCRAGMPDVQALHEAYADQGLLILAVNVGDTEPMARYFIEDGGYTFPVLMDQAYQAANAYEVTAIPRQVIIDASGAIRHDLLGQHAIALLDHETVLPALLSDLGE